jgi:hypothetical protein
MTRLDDWELAFLKAPVEGLVATAEANLHGTQALEPNDPERETQVNHWTGELRKARALLAKLQNLAQENRPT